MAEPERDLVGMGDIEPCAPPEHQYDLTSFREIDAFLKDQLKEIAKGMKGYQQLLDDQAHLFRLVHHFANERLHTIQEEIKKQKGERLKKDSTPGAIPQDEGYRQLLHEKEEINKMLHDIPKNRSKRHRKQPK